MQLPPQLYIGTTSLIGPTTHYGKVTFPDGVMLQLGQRSSDRDVWAMGANRNQPQPGESLNIGPGAEPVAGEQGAQLRGGRSGR